MDSDAVAGGVAWLQTGSANRLEVAFVFNFIPLNFIVPFPVAAHQGVKQTEKMKRQFVTAIIVILLLLDVSFRILGSLSPEFHITALEVSNIIMAGLSLAAYALINKQVAGKPQAFVRGIYGSSLLKLMVCMTAILAYVLINKNNIHKPSVFMMFGVYAVYSATETILLSRMAKKTPTTSTHNKSSH